MAIATLHQRLKDKNRQIYDLSGEGSPITLGLVAPDGTTYDDNTKGGGGKWQMVNGTWTQFGASGVAAWATVTGKPTPFSAVNLPANSRTVADYQTYLGNNAVFNVGDYGAFGLSRTVFDGAMTSASHTFTSATAAFTSADVGKSIWVSGAGASGALLATTITVYTNATTVTLAASASTTVSGATASLGADETTKIAAALSDAAVLGGTVRFPKGRYVVSAGLSLAAGVKLEGDGMGTVLVIVATSGAVALTVGTSTTALNYKNRLSDFAVLLTQNGTTGIRLQNTCGAALRDIYIESPTTGLGTRTTIGVDIDAGNVSSFFNQLDGVLTNHCHIGFKVESTGTSYATAQVFKNCSAYGDRSSGDTTSKGFWFTRTPVTATYIGNGEGSVVVGGNVEECGTGVHIEGGGISVLGVRYEPASNTTDVLLDTNSGNNTIGGSSTLATVTDLGASGSGNNVERTQDREGVFTTTMVPGSGSITLTSGANGNVLAYRKKGKEVTVYGLVAVASISSPATSVYLTLPFAPKTAQGSYGTASIRAAGLASSATGAPQAYIDPTLAHLVLEKFTAGVAASLVGDILAGSSFIVSCTYMTSN